MEERWKTKDGKEIRTSRSRPHQITLRLSDEELDQFRELVAASGMSQQEYIRHAVLNQTIINTDGVRDELRQVVTELIREGSNLNQIARSLNSMGFANFRSIDETTKELRNLWRSLRRVMRKIP